MLVEASGGFAPPPTTWDSARKFVSVTHNGGCGMELGVKRLD